MMCSDARNIRKKILIHYTHKDTLGHTTRTSTLCHAIHDHAGDGAEIFVLQGGSPQPAVTFPGKAHLLPIPAPFDSRASFRLQHAPQIQKRMRAQFVLQNARRINPDIFITEFFPFGRQDYLPELMPAIEYLKDRGCKIMASIGYPCSTDIIDGQKRELANVRNRLIALYDQLLIHTPAAVENSFFLRTLPNKQLKASYQQFYKTFADKIVYTGYLLPYTSGTTPQRSSMIRKKAGAYTIIVSRGGGAVYPKLITAALQASGILGDRYRFIISCGPATSQAEHDLFAAVKKQHAHRTVILKAHIPDLDFFFRHCDLAVSLCGYNTAVQLLSAGTPGIVVPFVNPASPLPSNEQTARALLLKDRLDSAVLSYQQLSARSLADEIRRKCAQPAGRPELPDDWLNGRADTCRRLFHC